MLEPWRIALNLVAVFGCCYSIFWLTCLYLRWKVNWYLWMIVPFIILIVTRVGIVIGSDWLLEYSRVVTTITFLFFGVGFHGLYYSSTHFAKRRQAAKSGRGDDADA